MTRLFGTDGVRGKANVHPITADMAVRIGRGVGRLCRDRGHERPTVVIGRDTRASGDMLEAGLVAGLCAAGVDAVCLGMLPTPAVAFAARRHGAAAGLVVSASHNAYDDNGFKVFSGDGFKLPDAEEDALEALIAENATVGTAVGRRRDDAHTADAYVEACCGTLSKDLSLKGMRLVLDCANGATCRTAPRVFAALGADVVAIHCDPDGTNINAACGSQHTETLAARVTAEGAAAGVAFDGDGDRLIAVDETGATLTGDPIIAICARQLMQQERLAGNLVVTTVMSNIGLGIALKRMGVRHLTTRVGDRYVLEAMRQQGAVLGGEDSGHMIFLEHQTTGDGIVSAVQLLSAMVRSGESLSALGRIMTRFPQELINLDVRAKPPLDAVPTVQAAVTAAEQELGSQGRVLLRYSGTQPMCRVMVEGPTADVTGRLCRAVADAVREAIG